MRRLRCKFDRISHWHWHRFHRYHTPSYSAPTPTANRSIIYGVLRCCLLFCFVFFLYITIYWYIYSIENKQTQCEWISIRSNWNGMHNVSDDVESITLLWVSSFRLIKLPFWCGIRAPPLDRMVYVTCSQFHSPAVRSSGIKKAINLCYSLRTPFTIKNNEMKILFYSKRSLNWSAYGATVAAIKQLYIFWYRRT